MRKWCLLYMLFALSLTLSAQDRRLHLFKAHDWKTYLFYQGNDSQGEDLADYATTGEMEKRKTFGFCDK